MIYENPKLSGSVEISGSLYVQGLRLVSSSNQIASEISGSNGILDNRVTKLEIVSASLEGLYLPAYDYLPNTASANVSSAGKLLNGTTYAYMLSALGFHWGASGYTGNETNTTSLIVGDLDGDYKVNEYLDSEPASGTALPGQTRLIPRDELTNAMITKIQEVGLLNSSLYFLTEDQVQIFREQIVPRKYYLNGKTEVRNTQTASLAYTASFVFNSQTAETAIALAPSAQRHNVVYVTNELTASLYATHIMSASVTLSAPTDVQEGDWIKISNTLSGFTSHISPNGNKLMGSTDTLELDVENAGFELVYTDNKHGWVIIGN
jgi:hypothetical protein